MDIPIWGAGVSPNNTNTRVDQRPGEGDGAEPQTMKSGISWPHPWCHSIRHPVGPMQTLLGCGATSSTFFSRNPKRGSALYSPMWILENRARPGLGSP